MLVWPAVLAGSLSGLVLLLPVGLWLSVWLPLTAWAVVAWVIGGWLFDRLSDSLAEAV